MSVQIANGMLVDIDRGPDWYFVRLHPSEVSAIGFAEAIYELIMREQCQRVIIELDELPILKSELVGQLVLLHKRLCTEGGAVRLSGTTDAAQTVLKQSRLADRFPQYANREDAVMGRSSVAPQ